jgi:hypothetical protein
VGVAGPAGAQGPAGEIELVVCKPEVVSTGSGAKKHHVVKQVCQTTLESSPVIFTATAGSVKATLRRAGRTYATGELKNGRLVLHALAALKPGRYTLWLTHGRKSAHQTVTITA